MEDDDKPWLPSPEEVDEYFEKTRNGSVKPRQSIREWLEKYKEESNATK